MEEQKEIPRPKRGEILGITPESPYRDALISLIVSIDRVIPLAMEDQVLMVIHLDTEEKIVKFNNWIKSKLIGENEIDATAVEIVQAAVFIGKGLDPLD